MDILDMLVEYGMAGLFIAYMIWQDSANSKKAEVQLEKFDAQLDKIREKQQNDERSLRDRYDSVIEKYDSERDELKIEVLSLIKDGSNQIVQDWLDTGSGDNSNDSEQEAGEEGSA